MVLRQSLALAALAALLVAGAGSAVAETSKGFTVSATIAQGCAVTTNSGAGGTWGNIDLGTAAGMATGSVTANLVSSGVSGVQLACTPGVTATLTPDQGNQASAGVRRMVHASQSASMISYLIYANNSATPWAAQGLPMSFTSGTQNQTVPVRAVATLSATSPAGAYADTIRLTLSW